MIPLLSVTKFSKYPKTFFDGVRGRKALSGIWLTTRFSFQIALYLLVKQKENVSLRALFCATLPLAFLETNNNLIVIIIIIIIIINFGPCVCKIFH